MGGDGAGQRRGDAGAGDDHAQAAHARVLGVLGDQVGLAVRGHHPHLVQDAALFELAGGLLHRLHVALGAHHDAHARGVDVDVLELRLHLGLVQRLRHERDVRAPAGAALLGEGPASPGRPPRVIPARSAPAACASVTHVIRRSNDIIRRPAYAGHGRIRAGRKGDTPVHAGALTARR